MRANGHDPVQIRVATRRDLPAVLELLEELWRTQADWRVFPLRPGIEGEVAERYLRAVEGAEPDSVVLVADDAGRVVGTAFGHVHTPSSFSDEPAVELSGAFVSPSHRGRGIGGSLARAVVEFARRRGLQVVTVKAFAQNEAALRFWAGMGFRPRMIQMVRPAEDLDP